MRSTVELAEDTAKAVESTRVELGVGVSEAVNELIRRAMLPRPARPAFKQRTQPLGVYVDASNIASALEDLEGNEPR